jgi:hypothetical protein
MKRPTITIENDDLVITPRERELIKNFRLTREYSQGTLTRLAQAFAERDGSDVRRASAPSLTLVGGAA